MNKHLFLMAFLSFLAVGGCNSLNHSSNIGKNDHSHSDSRKYPTSSFVKIHREINIEKCVEGKKCNIGTYSSVGSGISIGKYSGGSVVLTAGHMCYITMGHEAKGAIEKYSASLGAQNIRGELLKAHIVTMTSGEMDKRDMCMLYIPDLVTDPVKISATAPKVGDKVFSIAAPAGIFHPPTVPILSGIYSGMIPGSPNAITTVPAIGGSSGAAILNEDMAVVGVIYAVAIKFNNVSLVSNYYETLSFIQKGYEILLKKPTE